MAYAVWNPLPWGLFLAGIVVCVLSVRMFHRKYPNFPLNTSADVTEERTATAYHQNVFPVDKASQ